MALNNDVTPWRQRVLTGLPPGTYCNVVDGILDTAGMVALALPANDGHAHPPWRCISGSASADIPK